ncbi:MAG: beta-lactamase family protein, partial [Actinobacteria bacterium]|nr:beta-lactamase family protein [Actinomycetota bacterium]
MNGAATQRRLLDELVERSLAQHRCPSIAWGVLEHGHLVVAGGSGLLHDGAPPDEHTRYRIASMSKSFTTAAVLGLRDDGVLRLDDPITTFAPELADVVGPAGSQAVTLRHLLSMTSGLATDDAWADRHLDLSPDELDLAVQRPLFAHRVNESFEYSNLGFALIGRVVWRATGTRVQDHVSRRLLEPLGLHSTTWTFPDGTRWAHPRRLVEGEEVDDALVLGDGEMAPMGGLWSTVSDLARWVAWLDRANDAEAHDEVGLSASSRREMQRMQTYIGTSTVVGRTSPSGYGFGLNMRDDTDLGMVVAHSGGLPGYGSNMRWMKGRGTGAIALANLFYAPMHELTLEMLAALHDAGAIAPTPVQEAPLLESAARRLVALLNDWSHQRADDLFTDNVPLDESYALRAA